MARRVRQSTFKQLEAVIGDFSGTYIERGRKHPGRVEATVELAHRWGTDPSAAESITSMLASAEDMVDVYLQTVTDPTALYPVQRSIVASPPEQTVGFLEEIIDRIETAARRPAWRRTLGRSGTEILEALHLTEAILSSNQIPVSDGARLADRLTNPAVTAFESLGMKPVLDRIRTALTTPNPEKTIGGGAASLDMWKAVVEDGRDRSGVTFPFPGGINSHYVARMFCRRLDNLESAAETMARWHLLTDFDVAMIGRQHQEDLVVALWKHIAGHGDIFKAEMLADNIQYTAPILDVVADLPAVWVNHPNMFDAKTRLEARFCDLHGFAAYGTLLRVTSRALDDRSVTWSKLARTALCLEAIETQN